MDAVTTMREGTLHDLPGVYRVCRLTGHAGRDATSRHADPDLLGHLWAGPYLAFPEAVTRVIHDDQGVAGYCLAVPDTAAFEHWLETVWLPPLRERLPLGSGATWRSTRPTFTSTSFPGSRARGGVAGSWTRSSASCLAKECPASTSASTPATPQRPGSTSGWGSGP